MAEREGHGLVIRLFKSGTGFTATCECGVRLRRVSGGNPAGVRYGRAAAGQDHEAHLRELEVSGA